MSATFARAAVRPFAPTMSTASSSVSAALVRRMATGAARSPAAGAPSTASKTASFGASRNAIPSFASASFMAAAFRRASQRARQQGGAGSRRWQSSTAGAAPNVSWFQRMWDSPVGLKTVHFWAPVMKWALVLAGISDLGRPAEKLSVTQNIALTATGLIWTRWCLIIKPKNYLLAAVNFFLGIVGVVQCVRIGLFWQSVKAGKIPPPEEPAKEVAAE